MAAEVVSPSMMGPSAAHPQGALSTQRKDLWWVEPAWIVALFSAFVVYSFFRLWESRQVMHRFFEVDDAGFGYHYLSPFGTPDLTFLIPASLRQGSGLVAVMLANPAFLILPFPAGFRFTCYYYR